MLISKRWLPVSVRFTLLHLVCYITLGYLIMDLDEMTALLIALVVGVIQLLTIAETVENRDRMWRKNDE